jgi:predicted nucleotidyltransferase
MGVPPSSLQRELHDLSEAGILKTYRQGRMVYYQADTDSPVFSDLRGLLLKTAGLVDVLAQALKPVGAKLQSAFVYGSIAAGNERSDSDIDLMIIGQALPREIALPLRRARGLLGREINPTIYTPPEFDKKRVVWVRLWPEASRTWNRPVYPLMRVSSWPMTRPGRYPCLWCARLATVPAWWARTTTRFWRWRRPIRRLRRYLRISMAAG